MSRPTTEEYKAKLQKYEAAQIQMKNINQIIKGKLSEEAKIKAIMDIGLLPYARAHMLVTGIGAFMGRKGFASFELTNNGAEIRRIKKELEKDEKRDAALPQDFTNEDKTIRFVDSPADNRFQLFFEGKPDQETRDKLKRDGWRWAPSNGCWQSYRNRNSLHCAQRIMGLPEEKLKAVTQELIPAGWEELGGTEEIGD